MSAPRSPAVSATGLAKQFDGLDAVRDVSFTIPAGSTAALVGPADSGKTTVLSLLLGLSRPDSGTVALGGPESGSGRAIGAMTQERGLCPARTVRDEVRVFAAAAGVSDDRVDGLLALTRLDTVAGLRVRMLAPGLRTRVALAIALLGDPALLILDDPFAGLEPGERAWLLDYLRGHARRGGTTLYTSQSLAAALPAADQLIVLGAGSVVYQGSPRRLRRSHPDRLIVGASSPIALATMLAARGFTDAVMRPDGRLAVAEASRLEIEAAARDARVQLTELIPEPVHPDRVLATLTRTAAPVMPTPYGAPR
ncbi:ATP-binding cassette domain-containing protein [Nocardia sp. NPDC051570]|uniref:ATP-binding cassette domain-containing protein n=1 Tax=Nocardia sp. NPDC051570 TaxID=3364324 RepID=UPI0037AB6B37